jgi:predicted glycosyltransferase involved in capsule biosynthesis
MDRSDNLIKSLPSWIKNDNIKQLIIIDWSSKMPLHENAEFRKIFGSTTKTELIRIDGQKYYNSGKLLNVALEYVKEDLLLKLDSDYMLLKDEFLDELSMLNPKYFVTGHYKINTKCGLNGLTVVDVLAIKAVNGFREDFIGYGWEDDDLYNRLYSQQKLERVIVEDLQDWVDHLPHNGSKTSNFPIADVMEGLKMNQRISKTAITYSPFKYNICSKDNLNKITFIKETK